jgi:hypothetical protein
MVDQGTGINGPTFTYSPSVAGTYTFKLMDANVQQPHQQPESCNKPNCNDSQPGQRVVMQDLTDQLH